MLLEKGANTTLRNNENQTPFDLSKRNPEVGRLLAPHSSKPLCLNQCHNLLTVCVSAATGDDYGDEEDSD